MFTFSKNTRKNTHRRCVTAVLYDQKNDEINEIKIYIKNALIQFVGRKKISKYFLRDFFFFCSFSQCLGGNTVVYYEKIRVAHFYSLYVNRFGLMTDKSKWNLIIAWGGHCTGSNLAIPPERQKKFQKRFRGEFSSK